MPTRPWLFPSFLLCAAIASSSTSAMQQAGFPPVRLETEAQRGCVAGALRGTAGPGMEHLRRVNFDRCGAFHLSGAIPMSGSTPPPPPERVRLGVQWLTPTQIDCLLRLPELDPSKRRLSVQFDLSRCPRRPA